MRVAMMTSGKPECEVRGLRVRLRSRSLLLGSLLRSRLSLRVRLRTADCVLFCFDGR